MRAELHSRRQSSSLYLVNLTTGEEKYLTEGSIVSQTETFSWSPITQKLIYTDRGETGKSESNFELVAVDLNGNKEKLTDNFENDHDAYWSPDGQKILFWSSRPDFKWLYLMDVDGTDVQPVFADTDNFIFGFKAAWSPDSTRLAVSVIEDMDDEPLNLNDPPDNIAIVKLGKTNESETFLLPSNNRIRAEFINWSFDGTKLAYLSDRILLGQVIPIYTKMYVFHLETQRETQVAEFLTVGNPVWSPTEDIIAFSASAHENDGLDIYLVKSDGTGLEKLTEGGFYRVASWSPDGKKLAVEAVSEQLNEFEIYIFDIESRIMERVTDNNIFDAFPIWVEL